MAIKLTLRPSMIATVASQGIDKAIKLASDTTYKDYFVIGRVVESLVFGDPNKIKFSRLAVDYMTSYRESGTSTHKDGVYYADKRLESECLRLADQLRQSQYINVLSSYEKQVRGKFDFIDTDGVTYEIWGTADLVSPQTPTNERGAIVVDLKTTRHPLQYYRCMEYGADVQLECYARTIGNPNSRLYVLALSKHDGATNLIEIARTNDLIERTDNAINQIIQYNKGVK